MYSRLVIALFGTKTKLGSSHRVWKKPNQINFLVSRTAIGTACNEPFIRRKNWVPGSSFRNMKNTEECIKSTRSMVVHIVLREVPKLSVFKH